MSKAMIKTPVRVLDFNARKLHSVEYLNDDSTGNVRGEENEKKETILPVTVRINYSICTHKNRVFLYGGLDDSNQVLATMETFDTMTLKFLPVKYRGDGPKPVGRQGHAAVVMSQYNFIVVGGTYQDQLIDPTPVPENDQLWNFDMESG
jgi:hypothetical protein